MTLTVLIIAIIFSAAFSLSWLLDAISDNRSFSNRRKRKWLLFWAAIFWMLYFYITYA